MSVGSHTAAPSARGWSMPAPLIAVAGYLQMLAEVFREAREMERQAAARWPHLSE